MLSSLAQALFLEKDESVADDALAGALEASTQAVKQAFSVCPSYDKVCVCTLILKPFLVSKLYACSRKVYVVLM